MKKTILFFVVLLLLCVSCLFVGCKSKDKGVEFWYDKPMPEYEAILKQVIYEASGIPMTYIGYGNVASYQTAVQQTLRSPNAPGIFSWWSGFQLKALADNGLLEDLTGLWHDYLVPQGVSPDVAESLTFEGKIYAAPWAIVNDTIGYNKKIFNRLGLSEPTTFKEFLDICAKIKAAGIYPIGHHSASWGSFVWFQILIGSYDPQLYLDICNGDEKYTSERMIAAMQVWDDMLNKGYFSDPRDDWVRAFVDEEVAMAVISSGVTLGLTKDYGLQPVIDYDTFVMPSRNPENKGIIFFEVAPICVSVNSVQKEKAMEIMKIYFTKPVQQAFSDIYGTANTSQVVVLNPVVTKANAFTQDTDNYQSILRFYENTPAELRDVVITEMARFWARRGTINQVLAACQVKADEVFK